MNKVYFLCMIITFLSCQKECPDTFHEDYNNIYPQFEFNPYTRNMIEVRSNNGLKENIIMRKTENFSSYTKKGCPPTEIKSVELDFESTVFDFDFNITFQNSPWDLNLIFIQKFDETDSIESLRFYYYIGDRRTDPNYWRQPGISCISSDVKHEILDSLVTKFGTTLNVEHFFLQDFCNLKNPYAIKELFVHKTEGLLRFITVENTLWDLKKG